MARNHDIRQHVRDPRKRWVIGTFTENVWFWLFWVCHLAFASVMYFYLQTKTFRIGSRTFDQGSTFLPLYQADVSAMISAAVSITKFLFQTWCGIVWWRIIYILLGTRRGIRLPELTSIAAGIPALLPWKGRQNRGPLSVFFFGFTCLVFATQNFSTPFLLASISWNPTIQHKTTSVPLEFPVATSESDAWSRYNSFNPEGIGLSSAGSSSQGSPLSFDGSESTVAMRRSFANTVQEDIPLNSTVVNLLVPFILIDKFEWVPDPEATLDDELIRAVTVEESGYLNFSSFISPLTSATVGNAALLKTTRWTQPPIKTEKTAPDINEIEFPEPVSFNEERYMAVLVDRIGGIDEETPCPTDTWAFGQLPDIKQLSIRYYMEDKPFGLNCYAIAKLALRAGSYRAPLSTVVLPGVAEAVIYPANQSFLDRDFADPLVLTVLDAMPEVMRIMSIMNVTKTSGWKNLEGYARGMVSLAYQATWNVMTDDFKTETSVAEAYHPQYMIAILIEPKWFVIWLGAVYAGVLFGLVFICVANGRDEAGGVLDPALSAVRLDPSRVYKDVASLCSSAKLSKGHDRTVRVRFAKKGLVKDSEESTDTNTRYGHGYGHNTAARGEKSLHHGHVETKVCHFGILEAITPGGDDDDGAHGRKKDILLGGYPA